MLPDLLSLEESFGRIEAAFYRQDLYKRYGKSCVHDAIKQGYLKIHKICFGPNCGRNLCWLSEAGKHAACTSSEYFGHGS